MNVKDEILKIFPKPANEIKLAHIITAVNKEPNKSYYLQEQAEMGQLGFQVEEVDLEGKTQEQLRGLLGDKDIIYVQGGNVFWLLKHVRASGFDQVVKDLLAKGTIYIGVSAGSYICCPTIEMSFWKREQKELFGLTDFTGMNLIPFLLTVHYKSGFENLLKEKIKTANYPVKILTDQQAILVHDDRIIFVGREPEIRL